MVILGLHLFHDASMALFVDGQLLDFVELERIRRQKRASFLSSAEILAFLAANHLALSDVDVCAICMGEVAERVVFYDWCGDLRIEHGCSGIIDYQDYLAGALAGVVPVPMLSQEGETPARVVYFEGMQTYIHQDNFAHSRDHIRNEAVLAKNLRAAMLSRIQFSIAGVSPRAAFFVSHHAAHAQYALSFSRFHRPLLVTADGLLGESFLGGGIYFARDGGLYPQIAHASPTSAIYWHLGSLLGFNDQSGPGKLMGLSAYGLPIYSDERYVGTISQLRNRGLIPDVRNYTRAFKRYFIDKICQESGITHEQLFNRLLAWDRLSHPPELQANIAASIQDMFAKNIIDLLDAAVTFARRVKYSFDGISLSGGAFLNCPVNSFLYSRYGNVDLSPAVNDEGIALGAALIFVNDAKPGSFAGNLAPQSAYLGRQYDVEACMKRDFPRYSERLRVVGEVDPLQWLALQLHRNKCCAFYHGRGEIGPRALGHRSILANPRDCALAAQVNQIKNREQWRPLAPMVSKESLHHHFSGIPEDSYYMLFNARVKNLCLPAVTHVDGTARVQSVVPESGPVYGLLKQFARYSGVEVLLNTSFNGRNEPIVETPGDALESFVRMPLDYLYLDGYLLAKRTE
ncbi:carbamoyltransferase C-terminal domain-containing protein [Candidatus Magnetaquicoccus inordinatus]|uniref:carbamoyltransferase C-terminal domain-containing protein n=1 Tax=Candidatus Magnetaquicoccus inordinatus TaxID=2496818 RepID=UPI001D0EDF83|nr:carbamoyltransferase C-terminal domain-containing protein [Candidatus Magnetaquicoccus inordinatus]